MLGGYAAVCAVAALSTWLLTFVHRRVAVKVGAIAVPDDRRVHKRPTPTAGGAAMFAGLLVALVVASQLSQFDGVFVGSKPLAVLLAAAVIFAVGLLDDVREVSAPAKVAGQALAGSVLYLLGVAMLFFKVPFAGIVVLSPDWIPLATVLWLVVIANAVNLIDGLDGLAAGIVAIAAAAFFLYADQLDGRLAEDNIGPLVAVITVGLCLGFLPHNFNPARVFMGDAGAMLLGLLLAASSLEISGQTDDLFSGRTFFFYAPILIPFIILGVPLVDTAFAVVRRAARRKGVAVADKEHLHHRLMRLGHGQRRSVLILWAWTAILSALALFPAYTGEGNATIPIGFAALAVALYTLFHPGARRTAREGRISSRSVVMLDTPPADRTARETPDLRAKEPLP